MRNYTKAGMCSILTSLMLLAAGCLPAGLSADAARRPQPTFNGNAWIAYWDFDRGLKEAVKIQSQLNSVSYFAAAFDRNNKIILVGPAEKFTAQKFTRYKAEIKKYLTVVNDVYKDINNPAGESIEKDTQVLFRLFETDETMRGHSQDLLARVKKHRFDGLEIDYENIWKNPQLAKKFVRFLEVLVPAAEEAKIPLRVILEPGIPVTAYKLPEGPEYVLMCYNLFGVHSVAAGPKADDPEGPEYVLMCYNLFGVHSVAAGPKADDRFLDKMLGKVKQLPRPHSIALATGGCVWQEGKRPCFVTEQEALALQKELKVTLHRDSLSAAQYFNGKDNAGKSVECWFADAKTIIAWKRQALDYGVDGISLWRLGGNHKIQEYYPGIMNKK